MLEALGEWMGFPMYYAFAGAPPPARNGSAHATIFPYGPFPAGDGTAVMFGLQNEREWRMFCEAVLLQPQLTADPAYDSNVRRLANRDALTAVIVAAFAGLTAAEVVGRLDAAGIANAQVRNMAALWTHPQIAARDRWRMIGSPAGPLPSLLPPAGSDAFEPRMDPIPALGEHTATILHELGYTPDEVQRWRSAGVV